MKIDISIIITAYKEERTISKAIAKALDASKGLNKEILVLAPDEGTIREARSWESTRPEINLRVIRDPGRGKPAALNLAFKEAKGDVLILTDGDVFMSQYSIRELLNKTEGNWGIVSGRPFSISPIEDRYGYWSHLLTDMADMKRKETPGFVCTGYLYALKKGIVDSIPEDCLSDDAYISYKVLEKGYDIKYASSSHVFVRYPDNFSDWLKQKKRSTGGYVQLKEEYNLKPKKEMRSFVQELKGLWKVIAHPKTPSQVWWMIELLFARAYMWAAIFWERKIIKKDFKTTWTRIESTK